LIFSVCILTCYLSHWPRPKFRIANIKKYHWLTGWQLDALSAAGAGNAGRCLGPARCEPAYYVRSAAVQQNQQSCALSDSGTAPAKSMHAPAKRGGNNCLYSTSNSLGWSARSSPGERSGLLCRYFRHGNYGVIILQ
jgi:hypothetical protein